jgi:inner membrane protein
MDNLAHALVGAAIGRATAGHRVPRAAVLGAVAANAPDWAELFTGWPWPGAVYLAEHRGVTHALVGVAIEVVGLVAAAGAAWWGWHRLRPQAAPRVAWGWLALLAAVAVASHAFMDWQGSYGLRPLLPWSDRWYYGDFVAIVDPLYWIVPLVALAWGAHRHWWSLFGFAVVGTPATLLVLATALPAPWLKGAWVALTLVGGAGWIAHWFGVAGRRRAAAYALAVLAAYAAAQYVASLPAKAAVRRAAEARFGPATRWAALTVVGRPFTWEPMFASADTVAGPRWSRPRHLARLEVRRALRDTRDGRAIGRFARFLTADVDSSGARSVVTLRDARFARFGRDSWATVVVPAE